jgi:hypothetical protein
MAHQLTSGDSIDFSHNQHINVPLSAQKNAEARR